MKAITYWCALMFVISLTACTYDTLEAPSNCLTPFELEVVTLTSSSCGLSVGSFEVRVINPTPETELVQFTLDDVNFQDQGSFEGLGAGSYAVKASNGSCEASIIVPVENETGLNASLQTSPSNCSNPSGVISVSVSNEQGEVRYSIDGDSPQSSSIFDNLEPGDYQISVSDESGCVINLETSILSDVDFAAVDAIIRSNCAVSGCHNGNISPDFRSASTIKERAANIRSRTGGRSMPPASSGRSLSQAQIDAIACWVDDGAPQ